MTTSYGKVRAFMYTILLHYDDYDISLRDRHSEYDDTVNVILQGYNKERLMDTAKSLYVHYCFGGHGYDDVEWNNNGLVDFETGEIVATITR